VDHNLPSPVQELQIKELNAQGSRLFIKRDDLIHDEISGNKWRKLKYNLELAERVGAKRILTFGGAFSNHIAATAALVPLTKIEIHAFIKGEELNENSNPTLKKASDHGLKLHFIDREKYSHYKRVTSADQISTEWEGAYLIPEGGANEEGVKGCEHILKEMDQTFDYVCVAAGTGTTAAGMLRSLQKGELIVFPALKGGEFLRDDILSWQIDKSEKSRVLSLVTKYHFGGYAKVPKDLIAFTRKVKSDHQLPLDYVYTSKAFYGMIQMIRSAEFKSNSNILFYHSGGLQGNEFFEAQY